jgi:hypothetical protein
MVVFVVSVEMKDQVGRGGVLWWGLLEYNKSPSCATRARTKR